MTGRSQTERSKQAGKSDLTKTVETKPAKRKGKVGAAAKAAPSSTATGEQKACGHVTKGEKAAASAIDDIFGSVPSGSAPQKQPVKPNQQTVGGKSSTGHKTADTKGKSSRTAGSKDDLFASGPTKKRKYDAEGLPIFSVDELEIGKGKDTTDCPFDCDCCF